jgi:hypothetical protein
VVDRYFLQLIACGEELVGGLLPSIFSSCTSAPGLIRARPSSHPNDDLLERALAHDDGAQMGAGYVGGKLMVGCAAGRSPETAPAARGGQL